MKMNLLLLVLLSAGMIHKCKGNLPMITVPQETDEDKKNLDEFAEHVNKTLSQEDLHNVYSVAKNISHSKGPIIESKDGGLEYRRSLVRKISLETQSRTLKEWIRHIHGSDSFSLVALQELEHLVHQYETAVDFIKLGGMELILPLINHNDPKIASATLSVLTAAMQGNPEVQKYAEKARIIDYLIGALTGSSRNAFPSVLYALSSFLRNNPGSQLNFFRNDGLSILADILRSPIESMKSKLQVIGLLSDLSREIVSNFYGNPDEGNLNQVIQLQRMFSAGFQNANLCQEIPSLLDFDSYIVHEKVVSAMNSLYSICFRAFREEHVVTRVKSLIDKYDPYYERVWYSLDDLELFWIIWKDLNSLYEKIRPSSFRIKTEL